MTEQTVDPRGRTSVSALAWPDGAASNHDVLDRLLIVAKTMRLAIEAAREAPFTARNAELAPVHVFESWQAANLLVRTTFDALYDEVRDAVGTIRLMLPPR
jgi:hypothetical protein